MVDDLSELNESGAMGCPPEILEKSWAKDMIWYAFRWNWCFLYYT